MSWGRENKKAEQKKIMRKARILSAERVHSSKLEIATVSSVPSNKRSPCVTNWAAERGLCSTTLTLPHPPKSRGLASISHLLGEFFHSLSEYSTNASITTCAVKTPACVAPSFLVQSLETLNTGASSVGVGALVFPGVGRGGGRMAANTKTVVGVG